MRNIFILFLFCAFGSVSAQNQPSPYKLTNRKVTINGTQYSVYRKGAHDYYLPCKPLTGIGCNFVRVSRKKVFWP